MESNQVSANKGVTLSVIVLIASILLHILIIGWGLLYLAFLSKGVEISSLWAIVPAVMVVGLLILSIVAYIKRKKAKGSMGIAITALIFSSLTTLVLAIVSLVSIPVGVEGKVFKEIRDKQMKEFTKELDELEARNDSLLNEYKTY